MSLQQRRLEAKHLAEKLYEACISQHTGHPLLRAGRFNSGIWRQKWMKTAQKTLGYAEPTLYGALLPLKLEDAEGVSALWPWETRDQILPKAKTKEWLDALLTLDDHATIFVDLIPDLDVWVGDVFNYIPRDVWSMAAQLIARFYRSSKQLYRSIYPEELDKNDELYKEFFFAKVDDSLLELFDFSTQAKNAGTIRKVFTQLPEDKANGRYGSHAHVHRHGFYLLIHIAIHDSDWRQQMLNAKKTDFSKHISKINDKSCLSVLYTGLLEVAYFDGHSSGLDWSVIQGLGIPDLRIISGLPLSSQTQPDSSFQAASETKIRKKVLKIRALKSNIQLVDRLYTVNKSSPGVQASNRALYLDVERWFASDAPSVPVTWHECKYDYLAKWQDAFRTARPSGTSILYDRIDYLNNLSAAQQRHRLIECYRFFVGSSQYSLMTRGERKVAFFDVWYLLAVDDIFEGGFSTELLESTVSLVFEKVSGLNEPILTHVKRAYVSQNKQNEIGLGAYTKQIILLAILVHADLIKCHQDEIEQLIRDGALQNLFVLLQKGDTQTQDVFTGSAAQVSHYSASPIAVWLMSTNTFTGYRTPLIFQIIQSFLMSCATEAQKFHLFWRLSLYEADDEIYMIFAKNLYFPFHLIGAHPVKYTQVNWGDLCDKLSTHEKKRRELSKKSKSNANKKNTQQVYAGDEDVLRHFDSIWDGFLQSQAKANVLSLQDPLWKTALWTDLVDFWKRWNNASGLTDYLALGDNNLEDKLAQFFQNIQRLLGSVLHDAEVTDTYVSEVQGVLSQFQKLCIELDKGTETDFDSELAKLLAYSPTALKRQVPYEVDLMYSSVVKKLHQVMAEIVHNEKSYLEWNKEIQSPFISFDKLQLKFKGKPGYWKHTLKVFEATRVEQFVSQAWIDNLVYQPEWQANGFAEGIASFEGVFDGYPKDLKEVYEILTLKILEQPKKLGRLYSPLLLSIQHRLQTLPSQNVKDSKEGQWTLVNQQQDSLGNQMMVVDSTLRTQGLHGLAKKFTKGQVTSFGGILLGFMLNHGLSSFVAAVVSLTLLLDFGGSLLNLYSGNIVSSLVSVVAALAFAFGYPYASKHREMGVSVKDSVLNILPSFGVSVVMSYGLALIWTRADGEADFGIPAILLMLFFTTIVKAATDGAFDTDKD